MLRSPFKVSIEIRILDNNQDEQISILSRYINLTEKNTPEVLILDININYVQVIIFLNGGSSGSPVINIAGDIMIIYTAGFSTGATKYLLFINGPRHAFKRILKYESVSRGTIQ